MTALEIDFASRAASLAELYGSVGRVQIFDALELQSAHQIFECLTTHRQWNLVYRLGGRHTAAAADAVAQWPQEQRQRLERAIREEARRGFQYFFGSVPIYDIVHRNLLPGHLFEEIFAMLNSESMLAAVRTIIGDESVSFADAQATRYEGGHFLTRHDDDIPGKNRLAAYVLNLTPEWRSEWGGALEFYSAGGDIAEAWEPGFNVLNIFSVPSAHAVAEVVPSAPAARYAITGWFRSGRDPGP